jgi:hypothetical protein
MKSVSRVLSAMGVVMFAALASSTPALADYGGHGISVYAGNHGHGVAVSVHSRDHGYRSAPGHVRYERYPNAYPATASRDPWCPTHGAHHNHSYGYYGFNGGYYGVYDGNSYEEVFARAYDDGYSDGYNAAGRRLDGGTRPYRKGYERGYLDGRRDGRSAGNRYGAR